MTICGYCQKSYFRRNSQKYCSLHCALWSRVEIRGLSDCWPWVAGTAHYGYGAFRFENQVKKAHRVVALLTRGLSDLHVLHSCDNPACCNPAHLRYGEHLDNMKDMELRGRRKSVEGEDHHNSVVTEEDVKQIKNLIQEGWRQIDIAAFKNVKRSLVADISARRSWRNI